MFKSFKWFLVTVHMFTFYCLIFTDYSFACECEKKAGKTVNNRQYVAGGGKDSTQNISEMKYNDQPQVIYGDKYKNIKFIGADKCKLCHSVEYRKWQNTKHAKAYDDMVKHYEEQKNVNENMGKRVNGFYSSTHSLIDSSTFLKDCDPCHTTGFGYKFGFVDKQSTNNLTGVLSRLTLF